LLIKFDFRFKSFNTGPTRVHFFRHNFTNKLRADQQHAQFLLISPKVVKTTGKGVRAHSRRLNYFLHSPRRSEKIISRWILSRERSKDSPRKNSSVNFFTFSGTSTPK